ncbi:hypothetical protein [Bacillus cereus]|uniref:hypothetical protein n=1 Tax=Bacillus cereus TaxID=1396 RepID=UPI002AC0CCC6|nr:hypothetical protein [Bacillus cereus]MDZ4481531.1 hypothetical protein [Bacillus cereus]MDZ4497371.1 hypothetical protein [Bacillus cereus]MDZ4519249.1 hypothetical protein [Bacillus cereus]MDZ4583433.1 hypothetical protein [Bacillus cereus]
MKIDRTHSFSWINDLEEYFTYIDSNVLPLLLPTDIKRKLRWSNILKTYGLTETKCIKMKHDYQCSVSYITMHNFHSQKDIQKNWIILLNKDFLYPVYFYARKTNRSLILIDSVDEINLLFSYDVPESVLIIDEHKSFNTRALKKMSNIIYNNPNNIKWGVATAKDVAGISFVITKFLIKQSLSEKIGTLDIINKKIFQIQEQTGERINLSFSKNMIKEFVGENWDSLCIGAHGEGSHANLESLVLCGLSEEVEKDLLGNPIHTGCKQGECKRAHGEDVNVIPVYELKTGNCLFLSCNGFSVAGDLYPSDLSFILSASEGYIKNIITTTEVQAFHKDTGEVLQRMLKEKVGLGNIVNIHNDIQKNLKGTHPFILFGDPLAYEEPMYKSCFSNDNNKLKVEVDDRITIFKNSGIEKNNIYAFSPGGIFAFIGENYIVSFSKDSTSSEEVRKINKTKEVNQLTKNLNDLLQKLDQLKVFEDQLLIINPSIFQSLDKKENRILKKFAAHRTELTLCIERYFLEINRMYSNQSWNQKIVNKYNNYINHLTKNLYQCLIILCSNKSILKSLDLALIQHYYKEVSNTTEKCMRCYSPLNLNILNSKMINHIQRFEYDCPVCGLVRNFAKDSSFMGIEAINNPIAGSNYKIKLVPKLTKRISPASISYIIGEITDKSTGQTIYQFIKSGCLSDDPIIVEIPLTSNLGSDLHTIRVVLLSDYNISLSRFRFSAYNLQKN